MAGKKRRQVQKMTPTKSEMSDEEPESVYGRLSKWYTKYEMAHPGSR